MGFWETVDSIWTFITNIPLDGLGKLFGLICLGTVLVIVAIPILWVLKAGATSGGGWADATVQAIGKIIVLIVVVGSIAIVIWTIVSPNTLTAVIPTSDAPIVLTQVGEQPISGENSKPNSQNGICWTLKVENFYGNRSDAWQNFLNYQMRKIIPFDQFKLDVLTHNPQLKDDGYVFLSSKTYLLPELCP